MNTDTIKREADSLKRENFKEFINSLPQPAWIYEKLTFKFLEVNKAAVNFYGYSRKEFLNMTIKDIRPEDEIHILEEITSKNNSQLFHSSGWKHIKKDGSAVFTEVFSNEIIFGGQNARLVIVNDISGLIEKEKSLSLSAAIIESSEDAIIGKNLDGIITSWNEGAEIMYGYSKEEIINQSITILFPPENMAEFYDIMNKIKQGIRIEHYQTVRQKKDGSQINVSISISPIKDGLKRIIGASTIARDITKLTKMEAEREILLKNEIQLRERAEKSQERLALLSEASKILSSSLDYETTLSSIAGISVPLFSDWCAIDLIDENKKLKRVTVVHSDARMKNFADKLVDIFKDVAPETTKVYEVINSGVSKFYPSVPAKYFDDPNRNQEFIGLMKKLGISSAIIVPLKYHEKIFGAITYVMVTSKRNYEEDDLSVAEEIAVRAAIAIENARLFEAIQNINADLEKRVSARTEELEYANKELETFSYSVSHDLKAPLRAIEGFTKILLEEHSEALDYEAKRLFGIIITNASHMSRLIEDLLDFSRVTRLTINKTKFDMDRLVNSVFSELSSYEENRQIEFNVDSMSEAYGDPAMIRQVWINLISNAIKFTRPRDVALIKAGCMQNNGENIFFITDNGVGFDMRFSQNLFGVFQRLHKYNDFEGTGVGLALVERIIKRHEGKIWAQSEVDKGAAFYFTLGRQR